VVPVRPRYKRGSVSGWEVLVNHEGGLAKAVATFPSKSDASHYAAWYAEMNGIPYREEKVANRYPEFVVYKRGEDVRSIKMYLQGLDVNYVIDDGDGQFEVSVHANDLAEAKRRLTAKTAVNPYSPSDNPYVPSPTTPGIPDELLDGPKDPYPVTLDMKTPMTTRPRQMPGGGKEDVPTSDHTVAVFRR